MPFDFPASPTNGQQVTGANGVVWIWDGVKWVASTAGNPFPVAPTPPVGDNDTSIATTAFVQAAVSTALHDVGRNLIHNAGFSIAQRGAGPFTGTGFYTLDRWQVSVSTDAVSITQQALTDADRTTIGDEAAMFVLQNIFTGNAAIGAYNSVQQHIEGIRRLSGKTVTLSFWAKAASGAPKLGINALLSYGTGGSPSTGVWALTTGNAVTVGTTWARYTSTITMPTAVGKTFGTNGDDNTSLTLWHSSGATTNALAGNIGVQSGTIQLWGVQLEIGSVATPLEKRDPVLELQQCQRFYFTTSAIGQDGYASAANGVVAVPILFPVTMRASPSVVFNVAGSNNTNPPTIGYGPTVTGMKISIMSLAAGSLYWNGGFTASADL